MLKIKLCQPKNELKNFTNQLLENLKKVYFSFIDKICADLANMQLISKFNKGFPFFIMCY